MPPRILGDTSSKRSCPTRAYQTCSGHTGARNENTHDTARRYSHAWTEHTRSDMIRRGGSSASSTRLAPCTAPTAAPTTRRSYSKSRRQNRDKPRSMKSASTRKYMLTLQSGKRSTRHGSMKLSKAGETSRARANACAEQRALSEKYAWKPQGLSARSTPRKRMLPCRARRSPQAYGG